jgi:hypothetical protein
LADAPEGWERVRQFGAGELGCPNCGDGCDEENVATRPDCELCGATGYVYDGDCQVVIFKKIEAEESEESEEESDSEEQDFDDHNFGNAAW